MADEVKEDNTLAQLEGVSQVIQSATGTDELLVSFTTNVREVTLDRVGLGFLQLWLMDGDRSLEISHFLGLNSSGERVSIDGNAVTRGLIERIARATAEMGQDGSCSVTGLRVKQQTLFSWPGLIAALDTCREVPFRRWQEAWQSVLILPVGDLRSGCGGLLVVGELTHKGTASSIRLHQQVTALAVASLRNALTGQLRFIEAHHQHASAVGSVSKMQARITDTERVQECLAGLDAPYGAKDLVHTILQTAADLVNIGVGNMQSKKVLSFFSLDGAVEGIQQPQNQDHFLWTDYRLHTVGNPLMARLLRGSDVRVEHLFGEELLSFVDTVNRKDERRTCRDLSPDGNDDSSNDELDKQSMTLLVVPSAVPHASADGSLFPGRLTVVVVLPSLAGSTEVGQAGISPTAMQDVLLQKCNFLRTRMDFALRRAIDQHRAMWHDRSRDLRRLLDGALDVDVTHAKNCAGFSTKTFAQVVEQVASPEVAALLGTRRASLLVSAGLLGAGVPASSSQRRISSSSSKQGYVDSEYQVWYHYSDHTHAFHALSEDLGSWTVDERHRKELQFSTWLTQTTAGGAVSVIRGGVDARAEVLRGEKEPLEVLASRVEPSAGALLLIPLRCKMGNAVLCVADRLCHTELDLCLPAADERHNQQLLRRDLVVFSRLQLLPVLRSYVQWAGAATATTRALESVQGKRVRTIELAMKDADRVRLRSSLMRWRVALRFQAEADGRTPAKLSLSTLRDVTTELLGRGSGGNVGATDMDWSVHGFLSHVCSLVQRLFPSCTVNAKSSRDLKRLDTVDFALFAAPDAGKMQDVFRLQSVLGAEAQGSRSVGGGSGTSSFGRPSLVGRIRVSSKQVEFMDTADKEFAPDTRLSIDPQFHLGMIRVTQANYSSEFTDHDAETLQCVMEVASAVYQCNGQRMTSTLLPLLSDVLSMLRECRTTGGGSSPKSFQIREMIGRCVGWMKRVCGAEVSLLRLMDATGGGADEVFTSEDADVVAAGSVMRAGALDAFVKYQDDAMKRGGTDKMHFKIYNGDRVNEEICEVNVVGATNEYFGQEQCAAIQIAAYVVTEVLATRRAIANAYASHADAREQAAAAKTQLKAALDVGTLHQHRSRCLQDLVEFLRRTALCVSRDLLVTHISEQLPRVLGCRSCVLLLEAGQLLSTPTPSGHGGDAVEFHAVLGAKAGSAGDYTVSLQQLLDVPDFGSPAAGRGSAQSKISLATGGGPFGAILLFNTTSSEFSKVWDASDVEFMSGALSSAVQAALGAAGLKDMHLVMAELRRDIANEKQDKDGVLADLQRAKDQHAWAETTISSVRAEMTRLVGETNQKEEHWRRELQAAHAARRDVESIREATMGRLRGDVVAAQEAAAAAVQEARLESSRSAAMTELVRSFCADTTSRTILEWLQGVADTRRCSLGLVAQREGGELEEDSATSGFRGVIPVAASTLRSGCAKQICTRMGAGIGSDNGPQPYGTEWALFVVPNRSLLSKQACDAACFVFCRPLSTLEQRRSQGIDPRAGAGTDVEESYSPFSSDDVAILEAAASLSSRSLGYRTSRAVTSKSGSPTRTPASPTTPAGLHEQESVVHELAREASCLRVAMQTACEVWDMAAAPTSASALAGGRYPAPRDRVAESIRAGVKALLRRGDTDPCHTRVQVDFGVAAASEAAAAPAITRSSPVECTCERKRNRLTCLLRRPLSGTPLAVLRIERLLSDSNFADGANEDAARKSFVDFTFSGKECELVEAFSRLAVRLLDTANEVTQAQQYVVEAGRAVLDIKGAVGAAQDRASCELETRLLAESVLRCGGELAQWASTDGTRRRQMVDLLRGSVATCLGTPAVYVVVRTPDGGEAGRERLWCVGCETAGGVAGSDYVTLEPVDVERYCLQSGVGLVLPAASTVTTAKGNERLHRQQLDSAPAAVWESWTQRRYKAMASLNIRRGSQGGASIVHQVVVPLQYGEHSAVLTAVREHHAFSEIHLDYLKWLARIFSHTVMGVPACVSDTQVDRNPASPVTSSPPLPPPPPSSTPSKQATDTPATHKQTLSSSPPSSPTRSSRAEQALSVGESLALKLVEVQSALHTATAEAAAQATMLQEARSEHSRMESEARRGILASTLLRLRLRAVQGRLREADQAEHSATAELRELSGRVGDAEQRAAAATARLADWTEIVKGMSGAALQLNVAALDESSPGESSDGSGDGTAASAGAFADATIRRVWGQAAGGLMGLLRDDASSVSCGLLVHDVTSPSGSGGVVEYSVSETGSPTKQARTDLQRSYAASRIPRRAVSPPSQSQSPPSPVSPMGTKGTPLALSMSALRRSPQSTSATSMLSGISSDGSLAYPVGQVVATFEDQLHPAIADKASRVLGSLSDTDVVGVVKTQLGGAEVWLVPVRARRTIALLRISFGGSTFAGTDAGTGTDADVRGAAQTKLEGFAQAFAPLLLGALAVQAVVAKSRDAREMCETLEAELMTAQESCHETENSLERARDDMEAMVRELVQLRGEVNTSVSASVPTEDVALSPVRDFGASSEDRGSRLSSPAPVAPKPKPLEVDIDRGSGSASKDGDEREGGRISEPTPEELVLASLGQLDATVSDSLERARVGALKNRVQLASGAADLKAARSEVIHARGQLEAVRSELAEVKARGFKDRHALKMAVEEMARAKRQLAHNPPADPASMDRLRFLYRVVLREISSLMDPPVVVQPPAAYGAGGASGISGDFDDAEESNYDTRSGSAGVPGPHGVVVRGQGGVPTHPAHLSPAVALQDALYKSLVIVRTLVRAEGCAVLVLEEGPHGSTPVFRLLCLGDALKWPGLRQGALGSLVSPNATSLVGSVMVGRRAIFCKDGSKDKRYCQAVDGQCAPKTPLAVVPIRGAGGSAVGAIVVARGSGGASFVPDEDGIALHVVAGFVAHTIFWWSGIAKLHGRLSGRAAQMQQLRGTLSALQDRFTGPVTSPPRPRGLGP